MSFWLHGCCGKVGPVKQVNHTSWKAEVTPTDRPESVRNRCVIELYCGVVCVVPLPFWHFCCRGFCHRTESDLFLFLFRSTLYDENGNKISTYSRAILARCFTLDQIPELSNFVALTRSLLLINKTQTCPNRAKRLPSIGTIICTMLLYFCYLDQSMIVHFAC